MRYLHLMPLLRPRDGDNDGGYAVADYRSVRPDLGTMDDLEDLAAQLHDSDMSLVLDLVLNHVAREHEWARRARAGEPAYREYFHVFPDREMPDAYERTLPEVFPDFAPGNFTWDDELRGLGLDDVQRVPVGRQLGATPPCCASTPRSSSSSPTGASTCCGSTPSPSCGSGWAPTARASRRCTRITQVLRAVTRIACPSVAFLAEAIVAPTKLLAYLGTGPYTGKVSDLAYHNSLMVQIWSMLAARDVRLAVQALGSLPPKPPTATWLTYLRCHDDIGWAIMDEDAAAVGVTGHGHRSFLAHWYAGDFYGSPARGLVFQYNPDTDDRRTSGSAASLIGLEAAQLGRRGRPRGVRAAAGARAGAGLGRHPGDLER